MQKEEIPFTEDLMYEHGLLNRLLLIYEECLPHLNQEKYLAVVKSTAKIIQSFVENYHEVLEEEYVFPLFKKDPKYNSIIRVLIKQHKISREMTNRILDFDNQKDLNTMKKDMTQFLRLYRAHESREDTIIFKNVRKFIDLIKFKELSQKFDAIEEEKLGKGGYNKILALVIELEQKIGLHLDLYSS